MHGRTKHGTILLFVLGCFFSTAVFAQVTITDLKLIEDRFSVKRFSATFNYSGELGNPLFFGATALTDDPVSGTTYGPSLISKGVVVSEFTVTRPMLIDKDATTSDSIDFSFYKPGERSSYRLQVDHTIEWQSAATYFGLNPGEASTPYVSISKVAFDESIPDAGAILQALAASGLASSTLEIAAYPMRPGGALGIRFSADVVHEDFRRILAALIAAGHAPSDIGFDLASDPDFLPGQVVIRGNVGDASQVPVDAALLANITGAASMEAVFALLALPYTPESEILAMLLDNAETLNVDTSRANGTRAYALTEYVLKRDPQNARALIEMSRALYPMLGDVGEASRRISILMDIALEKAPDDPELLTWKAYVLHDLGDIQASFEYYEKAKQHMTQPIALYYRQRPRNDIDLGDFDGALELYHTLLSIKFTDAPSIRTQFYGLEDYLSIIEGSDSPDLEPLYTKLIADMRGHCHRTGYAHYLLRTGGEMDRARALNTEAQALNCEGTAPIGAMLGVIDWSKNSPPDKAQLLRLMIGFGDIPTGIFSIAQLEEGRSIMPLLVGLDIDIDAKDSEGMSPVHRAVYMNDLDALTVLTDNKANLNNTIEGGITPLILAVYLQNPDITRYLLEQNVDINVKTAEGMTARDFAEDSGNAEILDLMEDVSAVSI